MLTMYAYRLTIAYDGTAYCGWQTQPNGTAIQTVLQTALAEFLGEAVHATAAGRTDAGVHALGQVVSLHTTRDLPPDALRHGLQNRLPEDIVIRVAERVPLDFHARYGAINKRYRYVIHNSPVRLPFLRNYVCWQRSRLDNQAMHTAVQSLVGTHDFRCFESHWPNRSSSVRTVHSATVHRAAGWELWSALQAPSADEPGRDSAVLSAPDPEGEFVVFEIRADGFLYNMVRAIVGTLIHIGRRRWPPSEMARIITAQDRAQAGETAPASGLYLVDVNYPPPGPIASADA